LKIRLWSSTEVDAELNGHWSVRWAWQADSTRMLMLAHLLSNSDNASFPFSSMSSTLVTVSENLAQQAPANLSAISHWSVDLRPLFLPLTESFKGISRRVGLCTINYLLFRRTLVLPLLFGRGIYTHELVHP
jgi:hypothetical protein